MTDLPIFSETQKLQVLLREVNPRTAENISLLDWKNALPEAVWETYKGLEAGGLPAVRLAVANFLIRTIFREALPELPTSPDEAPPPANIFFLVVWQRSIIRMNLATLRFAFHHLPQARLREQFLIDLADDRVVRTNHRELATFGSFLQDLPEAYRQALLKQDPDAELPPAGSADCLLEFVRHGDPEVALYLSALIPESEFRRNVWGHSVLMPERLVELANIATPETAKLCMRLWACQLPTQEFQRFLDRAIVDPTIPVDMVAAACRVENIRQAWLRDATTERTEVTARRVVACLAKALDREPTATTLDLLSSPKGPPSPPTALRRKAICQKNP